MEHQELLGNRLTEMNSDLESVEIGDDLTPGEFTSAIGMETERETQTTFVDESKFLNCSIPASKL